MANEFVPVGVASGQYLGRARPKERLKQLYTSKDPNNNTWANDKEKVGFKLLEKMGWSEGKGLGKDLAGPTSHIKVARKFDNAGIGSTEGLDDRWIKTSTAFEDVLKKLNSKFQKTEDTVKEEEEEEEIVVSTETTIAKKKKKTKKHKRQTDGDAGGDSKDAVGDAGTQTEAKKVPAVAFHKRVTAKRVANYSAKHIAEIMGRKRTNQDGPLNSKPQTEGADVVIESGVQTIVSTVSTTDYFAMQMAKFKQYNTSNEADEKENDNQNDGYNHNTFHFWSNGGSDTEKKEDADGDADGDDTEKQKRNKKKKKHSKEEETVNDSDGSDDAAVTKEKKKKKRTKKD